MNAPFVPNLPKCPYCATALFAWRSGSWIDPCPTCRRPLVLVRLPWDRKGTRRLRCLIDMGAGAYGFAIVILSALFAASEMTAMTFAKLLTPLLFVIGSVLCVDGALAARSEIDRTWKVLRRGWVAKGLGYGKVLAGTVAMLLVATGTTL